MNIPKLRFKEFTDEWQRNSLNKLTTYVDYRGKTPQKTDNGIFLVTAKNIKMGYIDYEISKEYISENDFNDVMKRGFVQKGDVLFTTEAPMGNVAQIYNEHIALAQRVIKFRGIPLKLKNTFLKYNLMSFRFQNLLKKKAIGTTVLGIQGKILHKLPIIYPQLKEQEKIADFLSIVDKKVENLENTITSLENQKKGLLQQIFSQKLRFKDKNGNNYPNWEKKKLGDISDITKLAGFEFTEYVTYQNHGNIIALRGLNIKNNKLDLSDVKYIDNSDFNKLSRSKLYINDLLFTYVGTIGEVALINQNNKYYLAPNVCRIRPHECINAMYLLCLFNSNIIRKEINIYLTKSSQPALSMENIRKFKILVPCLEEQTKIANFLSAFDRKLENQKAQLEHWQQIKKGLLQQMFV